MRIIVFIFILLLGNNVWGQEDTAAVQASPEQRQKRLENAEANLTLGLKDHDGAPRNNNGIRVVFYNAENLFFPEDDSTKRDDDFTKGGLKRWTYNRYQQKLNNIYKVMMAVGGWEPPAVVGFCELEHKKVLEDLINKTPLKKFGYEIVHEESPDRRGIDVGFIYRPSKFKYLDHEAIRVDFPFDKNLKTRDVLHVRGQVLGRDTLSVFVNHWPSRWGGQAKSEPKRVYVASLVRQKIDALYETNPNVKVVVMGDMNDHANNKSLIEVLKAKGDKEAVQKGDLFNYMEGLGKNWQLGSHKYQGHWGTLDHIIVSEPLLNEKRRGFLRASDGGAHIFAARFLLEEDIKYLGLQPFRTYAGPRFIGGFSDHLPIYIDLMYTTGLEEDEAVEEEDVEE
ncbi:endonuclease [Aureispira sp. CCB-E]|uniref:endonuclease/exonuclease/phosphatase family protein n=1 Tax=Aureispira sp. CCB-E TaxID=3051121 RepID=UPI0028689FC0|nr:endonuclease [Aureispira sp. CCB-E]WMX15514.1 endonuclease [Aureispira sp. CCB-E]